MNIGGGDNKLFSGRSPIALYLILSALLMLAVVFASRNALNRKTSANSTSDRNSEIYTIERTIRRDLEETAVSSIIAYPNGDFPDSNPGLAMLSQRSIEDDRLLVTDMGTPLWQKVVYYVAEPDMKTPGVARLYRREGTIPALPSETAVLPDFVPSMAPFEPSKSMLLTDRLLLPGNDGVQTKSLSLTFLNEKKETSPFYKPGYSLVKIEIPLKAPFPEGDSVGAMPPVMVKVPY